MMSDVTYLMRGTSNDTQMVKWLVGLIVILSLPLHAADREYKVSAAFETTAPVEVVWDVLTDYNNIEHFVSFIKESELDIDGILHQKIKANWFLFSKTIDVTLSLQEVPYKEIRFENVGDASFKIYEGMWTIENYNTVKISYTLVARPNFFVPNGLVEGMLQKYTQRYINEIQDEIMRRAAVQHSFDEIMQKWYNGRRYE